MEMGVQGQALAALPVRRTPDPHCRKGWVSSRAGLDGCVQEKINTIGICTLDSPVCSKSLHKIHHPGSHISKYCIYIWKMIWHLQTLSQKMSLPVHLWYDKSCGKGNIPPSPYVTGNMFMSCMHANFNFSYSNDLLTITITMNAKHEFL
jgi:hypothetical protein